MIYLNPPEAWNQLPSLSNHHKGRLVWLLLHKPSKVCSRDVCTELAELRWGI